MAFIKDLPLGSVVQLPHQYGKHVALATLIRLKDSSSDAIVGWKNSQSEIGWDISLPIIEDISPRFKDYQYGWYVEPHVVVDLITQAEVCTIQSYGERCAITTCGTFCQYAIPNQKDGKSFVCFSCRQSGKKIP